MAREYSNKRSSRQRGSAPQQFLVIIVTFLLGYLTASIFDFGTISHWINTQVLAHHQEKKEPTKAAQQAPIPPKPKFEFYTLLANEKAGGTTQPNANSTANRAAPASPTQPASPVAVAAVATARPITKSNSPVVAQHLAPVKIVAGKPLAPAEANKGSYLIQVAAFKARQDAEHMKGSLILKGFDVNVVPISQAKGNWFRVVVGPYSNRTLAQKAQMSLARNERLQGMLVNVGG